MTPEVEKAISEIKQAFPGHAIDIMPEPQGGAYLTVHDLFIGDQYMPSRTWVGFQINFQYPQSDVYPHFIDAAIRRVDGKGFGDGISGPIDWQGRRVLQISRKSNRLDASRDNAALKLAKVVKWLTQR